ERAWCGLASRHFDVNRLSTDTPSAMPHFHRQHERSVEMFDDLNEVQIDVNLLTAHANLAMEPGCPGVWCHEDSPVLAITIGAERQIQRRCVIHEAQLLRVRARAAECDCENGQAGNGSALSAHA